MVDDQQNSLLAAALEYASWGWRILPLHSPTNDGGCTCGNPHCPCPGKHPHIARWSKVATADPTIIRQWWERWPDANIGVATGKVSGLAVLDVDPRNGGDEVLEDLERREGDLPATVESLTGGGGRHVLFRYPEGGVRSRNGLAEGLDLKSDGGYFVAPASRHAAGRTYQWELSCYPGEVPLAEVPAWLVTLAGRPSGNGNGTPSANLLKIPEGKRNDTLARLAGAIRRPGMTEEAIRQALLAENQARCAPPLAVAEVARIARSVARYPPAPFSRHQSAVSEIHNSDLGNARRLVARHGLDIHHVSPRREWLVWDGTRWGKDDSGEVTRRAKETVNHLYAQASRAADPETRKGLAKFAVQSESEPRLRGMIELAKTEPGVPVLPRELDTDPWVLNVQNGTLDLKTGELRPHDRGDLISCLAPVCYDPVATCPQWNRFLDRIMQGNERLIRFLQRAFGYSLTGSTREQVLFLMYGTGSNGKSTFLEVLRAITGDFAKQTDFSTFLEKRNEGIRNDVARLAGARFVTAVESERSRKLSEPFVKQATGSDTVTARFLYQESFEFSPTFKVWLATNHKPEIQGTDEGIWRRIRLIPFEVCIPKPERDTDLGEKLLAEAPGILHWAVEGCLDWQRKGLQSPPEVTAATGAYRAESDILAGFLEESCVVKADAFVGAGEIYTAYAAWLDKTGEQKCSRRWLGQALTERGFSKDRGGPGGKVRYLGIGLKSA